MNIYLEQLLCKTKWEVQQSANLSPDGVEWAALVKTIQLHGVGEQEQQFIVLGVYDRHIALQVNSVRLLERFLQLVPS